MLQFRQQSLDLVGDLKLRPHERDARTLTLPSLTIYHVTPLPIIMNFRIKVPGTEAKRHIFQEFFISLSFQNGGCFVGFSANTVGYGQTPLPFLVKL